MKYESALPHGEPTSHPPPPAPPVHGSEKLVLVLLSLHLCFLPWAIGTMHVWSQQISFALAAIAFLAAFLLNPPSTHIIPKVPAGKKLLKSPAFWLGAAILGYILTQALNPAFQYMTLDGEFFMIPIEHIAWLPSGMDTPFEKMNPFRRLLIFGSAFLTLWTIGLFLERPKSLRFLLWILALNGVALAALAFAQLFTDATQIFWKRHSPNPHFYASFIYKNHAAAYLNLVLALSIGLYFYFRERAWKENRARADKSPIFFFTSIILFTAVLFSNSRAGIVVAGVMLLLAICFTFVQAVRWNRLRETSVVSSIFLSLLILFAAVFTVIIGPGRILDRFEDLQAEGGKMELEFRLQAYQATTDMLRDNWIYGWGAGSFEYAFPTYQQNYPEITFLVDRWDRRFDLIWDNAHNDWLQYPAEYGVAGAGLFLIGLVGWVAGLIRYRALRKPIPLWLALGLFLTLLHAVVDFVLQNPAVIITFAAAIAISSRLAHLENTRRRKLPTHSG